ncbi:formylglycine-generating enzyme family protein [candidate division KSB1 bacterium]
MKTEDYKTMKQTLASILIIIMTLVAFGIYAEFRLSEVEGDANQSAQYFAREIESNMVRIRGGEFRMEWSDISDVESSVQTIIMDDYYINKFEVTQRQWLAIMGDNPSRIKEPTGPVENVSPDDVQKFLNRLSGLTGKNYRLPTKAEWEYACKADGKGKFDFENEFPTGKENETKFRVVRDLTQEELADLTALRATITPEMKQAAKQIEENMVLIPAGEFMMGSSSGRDSEKPVHRVMLDGYYLGKFEITQKEWEAVMGFNPSKFDGDDLPVESVNWNEAQVFLEKIFFISGKKYRLPTEAEWEYACRAGSISTYCFGDSTEYLDEYAWFKGNSDNMTQRVGQKKPNKWGLYDMHGNVWEMCSDWYGRYTSSEEKNPKGLSTGVSHVSRGGCYWHPAYNKGYKLLTSTNRDGNSPRGRNNNLGFRAARDK